MTPGPSAAPAAVPPAAEGGPQIYRGRLSLGVERVSFQDCWLDPGRHWGKFEAPPWGSFDVTIYEIEFRGRRKEAPRTLDGKRLGGFGHMGRYDCEYEILDLVSSQRVK